VPGAAGGNELADGLGDGGGLDDCDGLGLGVLELGVGVLGVGALGVLLEVVALGVPLAGPVGAAGLLAPGGNEGGVDGGPDEQADTAAVARTAKAAQPSTVPRKRRQP
jgi:hypothetical protein